MFAEQIKNGLELKDIAKNIAAIYDTSLFPGDSIPLHFHPSNWCMRVLFLLRVCVNVPDDRKAFPER